MRYPQTFIDTLKGHFRVSEVVGRRVTLKRHGREFQGLCPFHKEKTPSFTVNDEKGFYHCFGCGAHGDAIGFVIAFEGMSYPETIERLAQEAGLDVPKPSREEVVREQERRSLQDVTEAACAWFEHQLAGEAGYDARQYLAQRGLKEETISRFRVGFAPDDRDAMKRALLAEGITESQMLAAGLIIQPQDRPSYSRFRARVMFPIRDKMSRVIAFGGRVLPGHAQPDAPKYLNSPETELFKKGSLLYNLDLARKPAFDNAAVVLCEGYMDVIALAQSGIEYAVAPLGTAVTALQLQQLWNLCDTPAICLDGDAAGERAMQRVSELALPLLSPGKSLKFVRLPQGEDPDSLVRAHGAAALVALMQKAPGLADVLLYQIAGKKGLTPEERAGQEHQLLSLAEQIQNPTVKAHYRAHFKQALWTQKPGGMSKVGSIQIPKNQKAQLPYLPQAQDQQSRRDKAARQCVQLAVYYPKLLNDGEREEFFSGLQLQDLPWQRLHQTIMQLLAVQEPEGRADWLDRLREAGHDALLQPIMDAQNIDMPAAMRHDAEGLQLPLAVRVWSQAVNAYHLANSLQEYRLAEQEMSQDMSEATLTRFMELKAQLAGFERERERLQQESMLEEA